MANINYVYCRFCGEKFGSVKDLESNRCSKREHENHVLFDSPLQKSYSCMYCGERKSQLKYLVNENCSKSPSKYHVVLEEPDLAIEENDEPKTKKSAFGKSLKKSFKAMNDNGGDLYAGVDSVTEDLGDKFVQKTGLFGKAVRAMHDNGGDLYSGLSVVGESLLKTILLFIPRLLLKLVFLVIKLIFLLYKWIFILSLKIVGAGIYSLVGIIVLCFAKITKLIGNISFVHIFNFITKNLSSAEEETEESIELSVGKKIRNGFGTFFYLIFGIITFILWILTKITSYFSFAKFFNTSLNLRK